MPKGDEATTSNEASGSETPQPANLINNRPANQQQNPPPANQGANEEEAPSVLNERLTDQQTEYPVEDDEHSIDLALPDDEEDEQQQQLDDDLTMANLDELYQSIPSNPDEADMHPKRDDVDDDEDEEDDTLDDTLPVANAGNQMKARNQLKQVPVNDDVEEPTHYINADFAPVMPIYYHMTPRCVDDDLNEFGANDLLPFGASAATHVEHHIISMNRTDSNDVDTDNEGYQQGTPELSKAPTNSSSRRDSYQPDDDLAVNQPGPSRQQNHLFIGRKLYWQQEQANVKAMQHKSVVCRQQTSQRRHDVNMRHQINLPKVSFTPRQQRQQGMVQNAAAVVRARQVPTSSASVALGWQGTKSTLKERFSFMFCNEILADVHFLVGRGEQRQRVPAHKFVLSVGSAVFDAMFNGALSMHNDNNDIELPDVEPQAFLTLLNFLYSDDVSINPDTVMTTLYTAKKYAVPALETACVDFLKNHLSSDNAIMLLTQARLFDESHLAALCLEEIDKHSSESLTADGFADIDLDTLCAVLERDTLRIREVQLFNAVNRWSIAECNRQNISVTPANQRQVLGRALSLIRFPLMTVEEFASSVAQIGILNDREVVNLFLYFTVNPKPTTSFVDNPRCSVTGKEQVVNRFQRIEGRWGYSGTPDRIKFTVDRHIYVVGFGLYGSIHGPTEYQTRIEILHCGTSKTVAANETTFSCDGSLQTYRVLFKEPVELAPMVTYVASACLKGSDSHYGTKGLRRIVHQSPSSGCVTFQFTYAAGNNNGTSVEDGQIPEIIFYTKLS